MAIWRVVVFSGTKSFWSVVHTTFYDFSTKEEAVEFAKDEGKTLRRQDQYVWSNVNWFYYANIVTMVVSPRGDTLFGWRHFCLDEDVIRKECKDRQLDFDVCMAKREEVRAERGLEFLVKFS